MTTPLDEGSVQPALGLGLVVTAKDGPDRRGVVLWSNGRGVAGHYRMFADDSYVIQTMAGAYVIGNDVDSWVSVPETEWSSIERVISASVRWEPATWDDPAENDDHGFALMAALLPPSERDLVFGDGDWPCDYLSLATSVAEWLDESTVAANDSATNGVGMDPATDAQTNGGTQTAHDAAGHVSATWRTCGASECRAAREMFAPCCEHCGCQLGDRTGHDDYCATDGCVGSSTPGTPNPDIRVVMPNDVMAEKMTLAIRCANAEAALATQSTDLQAARARIEELESLLGQWCHTRANAAGALTNHYPIDGSGHWVTEAEAWGCNSCGEGWPCFVARSLDLLATTPSSAEEPKR